MAKNVPISIGLRAEGTEAVKSALRGVKQSFVEMERDSLAATKDASKQRLSILKSETQEKIALLKDESKARREIMQAEANFKRTINRKESEYGFGAASKALVKGEGFDSILKAAGVAGIAVAGMSAAINFASASLKQFGSFVINDVIKPAMALETKAVQVANQSGGRLTSSDVQSKARAAALKNNMDPMQIIESAGIFQDLTGDSKLGFDMMGTLATLSKARGFDVKDLTSMAGALYKPGMKKGELDNLLLMLTAQGETGSVTLGQQARLGGKLTAPAASLAGDYQTRIAMTSALLQSGRRGFGTVEEAATSLSTIMQDAMLHGKQVSPRSFVRDASGVEKLADPARFIADVYRKTQGNASMLHAMQLAEPTTKLIGAYKETYGEAFNAAKAGGKSDTQAREDAAQAVEAFIKSFATANTTMQAEEAKRNAVLHTSGEEMEKSFANIKDRILGGVGGSVDEFVNAFKLHEGDIANAASVIAKVIISLGEFGIAVANGISRLKGLFADEGDVLRTVGDRGASTEFPTGDFKNLAGIESKGYWRKGENGYEQVKGEGPGDAKGRWKRVGKNGQLVFIPGEEEAAPANPAELMSVKSPEENASTMPDDMSPAPIESEVSEAQQEVADSHEELASRVDDASEAVSTLSKNIDELNMSLSQLNRSQPFTNR